MAGAVGRREGLAQVAALTQGYAVLVARATLRCALKTEKEIFQEGK